MVTPRAERRLAAILAADVVGYSSLMERDEDRTLARLKALRREFIDPLIAEYQGRTVKLVGDGALVEFASVVDAVRCAVLIQQGMAEREAAVSEDQRIRFRIGINLGDVIREPDGDLYGDGVNVAARLEQLAEPGGVVVSGTAYDHLQGKLDLPLEFAGEQRVKNIERLVRAYRVRLDGTAVRFMPSFRRARRLALPAVAALAAVVFAAGIWHFWPGEPPPKERPAVAVLPFENLGGDEATGRLADGLTEDTITDLARFRDLEVIGRTSTAVYKGKPADVREIGKALNVGYVLEGSIQRQADRVRVTAQLIDAGTGAHLWSESWDRPVADVFAVQTEVADAVASRIGGYGQIAGAERAAAKRKRPTDLTAYDLYVLGMEAKHRLTKENIEEAFRLLKQAVERDPQLARAWTGLAWAYEGRAGFATSSGERALFNRQMLDAATRAVQLDPADAEAHMALGHAAGMSGDVARAEAEMKRGMALNPNGSVVLRLYSGWASTFGEPEKGAEAADRLIRLDPNFRFVTPGGVSWAFFIVGRYEEALRELTYTSEESLEQQPMILKAGSLAALGRADEARAVVARALARFPYITIEGVAGSPEMVEIERQRLIETMRKAGFPACLSAAEIAKLERPVRLPECEAERGKAVKKVE
jgi:TolB-like protein/class 3 adenylate cyclase